MTAAGPLPDSAKPITLPIDGTAELLTEYAVAGAPLLIINTSDDLAYVAGTTSVSANNGVPLEPGTALPWTAGGTVYAAAAPGTAVPIQVVITSAVPRWDPSPAAIGAEVATQLIAQGLPNVYLDDFLGKFTIAPADSSPPIDVHKYGSVCLIVDTFNSAIQIAFQNQPQTISPWNDTLTNPLPSAISQRVARVNVQGYWLNLNNLDPTNQAVIYVVASNRVLPKQIDSALDDGYPMEWNTASVPMVAGTNYALGQINGNKIEGPVFAELNVGSGTVKGFFSLDYSNDQGQAETINISDTGEMHAVGSSFAIFKPMSLPRCGFGITFHCTTSGTAGVRARFIKAS